MRKHIVGKRRLLALFETTLSLLETKDVEKGHCITNQPFIKA
jgi:hypothetical protein